MLLMLVGTAAAVYANAREWTLESVSGGFTCGAKKWSAVLVTEGKRYTYHVPHMKPEAGTIVFDSDDNCYRFTGALARQHECVVVDDEHHVLVMTYERNECAYKLIWRECSDGYLENPCPAIPRD
jgi:hypothetical protein